ncbi:MAG: radical SAM family heme chaperone HemW [Woeseiaceae bacterium]
MQPPPLALYVHLPWCVRKCPYCDFNSHSAPNGAPRERYVSALLADLDAEAARANERPLVSVFLGGGTPSLFPPEDIARLVTGIQQHFELKSDAEITMEANPGTVECGDPAGYRDAGINRLSIGAQSFNAAMLQALGRIHSVEDIVRAVEEAQQAGFDNFNLDLMYGLPNQTIEAAMQDLRAAGELQPTHISWYQLTLEPNTVFHARPPAGLPDNDEGYEIQSAGQELLGNMGYEQYETSAYARGEQRRSVHNLNYWSFGDYLAVGAGAHGKISNGQGVHRYTKPANPLKYMEHMEQGALPPSLTALGEAELVFEFMLNALRLSDGFNEDLFVSRTGLARTNLVDGLTRAQRKGLIEEVSGGFWRATELGQRFLNDLQAEFLPAS